MREKGTRNQGPAADKCWVMGTYGFRIAPNEGCWLIELSQVSMLSDIPFIRVGRCWFILGSLEDAHRGPQLSWGRRVGWTPKR